MLASAPWLADKSPAEKEELVFALGAADAAATDIISKKNKQGVAMNERLGLLREHIIELVEEYKNMEAQSTPRQPVDSQNSKIVEDYEAFVCVLRVAHEKTLSELTAAQAELVAKEEDIESLEVQLEDKEQRAEHAFKMLAEEEDRVEQLSVQLTMRAGKDARFNKDYKQAQVQLAEKDAVIEHLRTQLGNSSQQEVAENRDLNNNAYKQAQIELAEKDAEIAALNAKVEQEEKRRIASRENSRDSISLQGLQAEADGYQSDLEASAARVKALEEEIENLRAQPGKFPTECQNGLSDNIDSGALKDDVAEVSAAELVESLHKSTKLVEQLRAGEAELQKQKAELELQNQELQNEKTQLQEGSQKLHEELQNQTAQVQTLQERSQTLSQQLKDCGRELHNRNNDYEMLEAENRQLLEERKNAVRGVS